MLNFTQPICTNLTLNSCKLKVEIGETSGTENQGILMTRLSGKVVDERVVELSYPEKAVEIDIPEDLKDGRNKSCEVILKLKNGQIASSRRIFKMCD